MRSQLLEYVDNGNGGSLQPIVATAIRTHRKKLLSQE
jgi:hypothetical protein